MATKSYLRLQVRRRPSIVGCTEMRLTHYCAAEDELQAYADGVLPACRRPMVESYLGALPEEQKRIESYRRLNVELHRMYDRPEFESIPRSYGFLASQLARAVRRQQRTRQLARGGATLFIAIAATMTMWTAYKLYGDVPHPLPAFTQQVTDAHFMRFDNGKVDHKLRAGAYGDVPLGQAATQFVAMPQQAPDLARLGFELTSGKVVMTSGSPAMELLYRGIDERRMMLTIKPADSIHKTAFIILEDSDVSLVSWQVGPLTYNLVANIDRGRLLDLARAVSNPLLPARAGDRGLQTPSGESPKPTPVGASPAARESALEGATVPLNAPVAISDAPAAGPRLPDATASPAMAPAAVRKVGLKPATRN